LEAIGFGWNCKGNDRGIEPDQLGDAERMTPDSVENATVSPALRAASKPQQRTSRATTATFGKGPKKANRS
jgi:hypothetical protein